jgi:hypothetical protein
LIVLFFIPALWQDRSANPTLFPQNLGDGCESFSAFGLAPLSKAVFTAIILQAFIASKSAVLIVS